MNSFTVYDPDQTDQRRSNIVRSGFVLSDPVSSQIRPDEHVLLHVQGNPLTHRVDMVNGTPTLVELLPAPPINQVPPSVTQRQLRLWLLSQGITDAMLRAQIGQLPTETEREAALIEYDYAQEYRRDHPLIAQIATNMGMTAQQIDEAFIAAAVL